MSTPEWPERDDELDGMLANLGTPGGAHPQASPAEILGRAALLAPPVIGLTGWRLAAVLALAVGGGFLGGLWFRETGVAEAPGPLANSGVLPAPTAPQPRDTGAPETPAPMPTAPPETPSHALAARPRAAHPTPAPASTPEVTPPETAAVLPDRALANACPGAPEAVAAATELPDQDVDAIRAMLPNAPLAPPAPAQVNPPALAKAEEDQALEEPTTERARGKHTFEGRVGVGAMVLPGQASGLVADLGLQRGPSEGGGTVLAADLNVDLIAAPPGARWSTGLNVEAGHAWRVGRTEIDAGWTAGARMVLPAPAQAEAIAADSATRPGPLEDAKLHVFPTTGPKVGVAFGEPGSSRIRLDLATQLSPGTQGNGPQPWISLAIGSSFPFSRANGAGGKKES